MAKFYDDEEYYGGSFEKFTHRKPKNHKKGHQSRSSNSEKKTWELIIERTEEEGGTVQLELNPVPLSAFNPPFNPQKVEHQFGENTHEIKGVKIDYDGVADIQKIDNVKDGRKTYGIKFFFKGKKGLFRIIWFNSNIVVRDATFDSEYAFWKKL